MGILRYFLAIVVVIGHSPLTIFAKPLNGDGGLAVQTFYVISGFYMALIVNKYRLQSLDISNIKNFYLSRCLRIYPVYWICFLVMWGLATFHLVSSPPLPMDVLKSLDNFSDKIFYIFQNIFIFGQGLMRFTIYDPNTHAFFLTFTGTANYAVEHHLIQVGPSFLGQSWTLSLELTFYLLVPFILTRKRNTVIALCALSLLLKFSLYYLGYGYKNYNIQVAFFPSALGVFLLGAISQQIIYPWLRKKSVFFLQKATYAWIFGLILYVSFLFPRIGSYDLKSGLFVLLIACSLPFLFCYYSKSAFDRFIGDLSFPVYMTHVFCIGLVQHSKLVNPAYIGYWVVIVSTMVSIFLVRFVMNPLDKFRHTALVNHSQSNAVVPIQIVKLQPDPQHVS